LGKNFPFFASLFAKGCWEKMLRKNNWGREWAQTRTKMLAAKRRVKENKNRRQEKPVMHK